MQLTEVVSWVDELTTAEASACKVVYSVAGRAKVDRFAKGEDHQLIKELVDCRSGLMDRAEREGRVS